MSYTPSRAAGMVQALETIRQDLRHGLRMLRRSPGFAFTAVLVIALGIGATAAAFTLLDHVLLRPLPFAQPDRLVRLFETELANGYPDIEVSPPNFFDWRAASGSFSAMGAYTETSVNLSGQGEPVRIGGALVTSGLFPTLGVAPAFGRGLTAADDQEGAPNVVLLGHALATTLYGEAADALGRTLSLDNETYSVIGVMPPGFVFPTQTARVWTPLRFPPAMLSLRRNHLLDVVARLRPEVSVEQARADLRVVASRLERAYPTDNAGIGATVMTLRDVLSPQSRMLVLALFGAAFCLMLIACTNLANLLFARASVRRQEMAVRIALGASRTRLLRQLLTEGLVLAFVGGGLGLLLAAAATPLLARLVPTRLPVDATPGMNWRVIAFAAALTLTTSLAFSLGPALRSWRGADPKALRSRSSVGARTDRLRSALVLAEVAGTVALLVAAGLLLKALWRVQAVDPGFRADGVLTLRTALPSPRYDTPAARRDFYMRVLTDARALPGVTSVAYTTALPLTWGAGIFPVTAPGAADDPASAPRASIRFVTADYFSTLGIAVRRGRAVRDDDGATAPFVAVISQSLADRLWPGQEPIGRTLRVADADRAVVGVVRDVAVRGLERSSEPQIYCPWEQFGTMSPFYAPKDLAIRTAADPSALVPAIRRIVREADPDQAISNVRLFDELVASQTAPRRDQLFVLSTFAAIAFLLAGVGIHGLLSFTVSTRTAEIGVRAALGAARGDILAMFLRQGLLLGLAGVVVAMPLAYAAARGMSALLFGVEPGDPLIYAAAAFVAMAMTLAGSLRPAVRASAVDPAITMRGE